MSGGYQNSHQEPYMNQNKHYGSFAEGLVLNSVSGEDDGNRSSSMDATNLN